MNGSLEIADVGSAELGVFANLRRVGGNLLISGPEVTDLDAFGCLEAVRDLSLTAAPALTDASGLAGLKSAPYVRVSETGLASLPTFAPEFAGIILLHIVGNPALVDLDPAASWIGLDGLSIGIEDNAALTDVSGLAGPLNSVPGWQLVSVWLERLPALTSLAGVEPPDNASLALVDLPLVPDLVPLSGLTGLHDLTMTGLPLVTSLDGLHDLAGAFVIRLGDCGSQTDGMPGLADLSGLDALNEVMVLSVVNCPNVTSLAGAPALMYLDALDLINDPQLGEDDVAAFLPQLTTAPQGCIGGWDACRCSPFWFE